MCVCLCIRKIIGFGSFIGRIELFMVTWELQFHGASTYSAYRKSTPSFQNFHLLLPYSLELNWFKSGFSHLYLYSVTHNFQVKNKFHKINEKYKTRISWLDKCPPRWVNTWWKHSWQQLQLWACWVRSLSTLHPLIGKHLHIFLYKTVQAQ